jgi:hypothetical protein
MSRTMICTAHVDYNRLFSLVLVSRRDAGDGLLTVPFSQSRIHFKSTHAPTRITCTITSTTFYDVRYDTFYVIL